MIYYDDQHQSVDAPLQIEECDQTAQALLRHLRDERYRSGRALDLLTLATLRGQRGLAILQSEQIAFLRTFLQTHAGLGDHFQREDKHVQ